MLSLRFYYLLKPLLPWRLRMGIRSMLARRKRIAYQSVWPIDPSARKAPEGWQGWPKGKKFAVVLTHDVEGPEGLAKCRKLAQLEIEQGFRSSFNFIPEGTYKVTAELRSWLTDNGFEVGVHDLNHDGKLFKSHSSFKSKAARINQYLKAWGAAGFRGGFMLRNLEWTHELNIQYDASTFDSDPFEPQPDGVGTIFPFWIPKPSGKASPDQNSSPAHFPATNGYVELPYTLPQDSTLFLLLREKSPEIWLNKSDWIAEQGGMVLVNVHPDYVQFEGEAPSPHTFPVAHYRRLLEYIRSTHSETYWQPLAKEVATHTHQTLPCL